MTMTAAYDIYVSRLAQLRQLIDDGKGDSPEADDLRDRLDAPWEAMTADEREKINGK
jgi:hypothetical protein